MGIPTIEEMRLAEVDHLHNVVMIRCRNFIHAGHHRDHAGIKQALQAYCDAVVEFVNEVVEQ